MIDSVYSKHFPVLCILIKENVLTAKQFEINKQVGVRRPSRSTHAKALGPSPPKVSMIFAVSFLT